MKNAGKEKNFQSRWCSVNSCCHDCFRLFCLHSYCSTLIHRVGDQTKDAVGFIRNLFIGFQSGVFSIVLMLIMTAYSIWTGIPFRLTYSSLRYTLSAVGFFSVVTFPFMFLLAIALSVSNVWLVRHEGFRLINLLGILLGILIAL